MANWYEVAPTLYSMTIPACFKIWVVSEGDNCWRIEISRRAKIAVSTDLDGVKAEAIQWARELLTAALAELDA